MLIVGGGVGGLATAHSLASAAIKSPSLRLSLFLEKLVQNSKLHREIAGQDKVESVLIYHYALNEETPSLLYSGEKVTVDVIIPAGEDVLGDPDLQRAPESPMEP
ncbi:hypothetical protein BT96DRAFT_931801 [Gymnopus androsaceus JB14]|uniref:FAD/NAD(P)-binding domain-containing protein n=1 Tax=Gymnopus androsaceus JB14 TaxID=1447944 RepID=A0A6A4II35_9AGAR|nr:hypothetical protein BT96DRAFT_931801 [Gymnopus androsaceus JB14]